MNNKKLQSSASMCSSLVTEKASLFASCDWKQDGYSNSSNHYQRNIHLYPKRSVSSLVKQFQFPLVFVDLDFIMVQYSIYHYFFVFCINLNLETKNILNKSTPLMAVSNWIEKMISLFNWFIWMWIEIKFGWAVFRIKKIEKPLFRTIILLYF